MDDGCGLEQRRCTTLAVSDTLAVSVSVSERGSETLDRKRETGQARPADWAASCFRNGNSPHCLTRPATRISACACTCTCTCGCACTTAFLRLQAFHASIDAFRLCAAPPQAPHPALSWTVRSPDGPTLKYPPTFSSAPPSSTPSTFPPKLSRFVLRFQESLFCLAIRCHLLLSGVAQ